MEISDNYTTLNSTYYIPTSSMEIVNGEEIIYLYADGKPFAMNLNPYYFLYYILYK